MACEQLIVSTKLKTELRIHENGNEKDYKRIVINIDDLKKNSENIQDPLDCLKNHIRIRSSKLFFREPYFIFEKILYYLERNRSFDQNKSFYENKGEWATDSAYYISNLMY